MLAWIDFSPPLKFLYSDSMCIVIHKGRTYAVEVDQSHFVLHITNTVPTFELVLNQHRKIISRLLLFFTYGLIW